MQLKFAFPFQTGFFHYANDIMGTSGVTGGVRISSARLRCFLFLPPVNYLHTFVSPGSLPLV